MALANVAQSKEVQRRLSYEKAATWATPNRSKLREALRIAESNVHARPAACHSSSFPPTIASIIAIALRTYALLTLMLKRDPRMMPGIDPREAKRGARS